MTWWCNICLDCWWIDSCGKLAIENLGNYLHVYLMCRGLVFYHYCNDSIVNGVLDMIYGAYLAGYVPFINRI